MLQVNQQLDKLAAMHTDFVAHGMLPAGHTTGRQISHILQPLQQVPNNVDNDSGPVEGWKTLENVVLARTCGKSISLSLLVDQCLICEAHKYPWDIEGLSAHIGVPNLHKMMLLCISTQLGESVDNLLPINAKISMFHLAVAMFHAPSDLSSTHGLRYKRICSTPSWRGLEPHCNCTFIIEDDMVSEMRGMAIIRIILFFSFEYEGVYYPCTLVEWFRKVQCDPITGMWVVHPDIMHGRCKQSVLHLDVFYQGAHLIPVYGKEKLPLGFHFSYSLNAFCAFYVNKYVDHHANEIIF